MSDKAVVLNKFWATILTVVMGSGIVGGIAYAWNANAQIAVLQRDMNEINEANINVRLTRIEAKLDLLVHRGR